MGILGKEANPESILETSIELVEEDAPVFTAIQIFNGSIANNLITLKPGPNEITFEGVAFPVGCFVLNHFEIQVSKSLVFSLHYQQEISKIANLDNVYLSVDIRMPVVKAGKLPGL